MKRIAHFILIASAYLNFLGAVQSEVLTPCEHICTEGACAFAGCDSPSCPGGACSFRDSALPTCDGKNLIFASPWGLILFSQVACAHLIIAREQRAAAERN